MGSNGHSRDFCHFCQYHTKSLTVAVFRNESKRNVMKHGQVKTLQSQLSQKKRIKFCKIIKPSPFSVGSCWQRLLQPWLLVSVLGDKKGKISFTLNLVAFERFLLNVLSFKKRHITICKRKKNENQTISI